jgi:hypothetical protein
MALCGGHRPIVNVFSGKLPLYPAAVAFSVALSTLLLQLLQTRIYSVVYWNHLVYFIISVALLGFGISGTWLALGDAERRRSILTIPVAAGGYFISLMASSFLIPYAGLKLGGFQGIDLGFAKLLATYTVAVLPYFFGGWILGVVFRDNAKHMHFLYFADLVGAGLGCLLFLLLIRPLGPVVLALMCGASVLIPVFAREIVQGRYRVTALVLTLAVVGGFAFQDEIALGIVPDEKKAYSRHLIGEDLADFLKTSTVQHEFSEWNAISRIDVLKFRDPEQEYIYIDGDAWTGIARYNPNTGPVDPGVRSFTEHWAPYASKYLIDSALIIGPGGGGGVSLALRHGASKVDAVEINPTTARIGLDVYRETNDNLFHQDGVTLWVEEGRSFVYRSDDTYDLVLLKGIDTFAALSSGAYVLSENYLYTVEALKDYIRHLTPDGQLCIVRWEYRGETPRLFAVALEALYDLGISNPEDHIFLGAHQNAYLLVRPTPYTEAEIQNLRDNAKRVGGRTLFPPVEGGAESGVAKAIHQYADARAKGTTDEFLKTYRYDVSPVWDDSPFFFHYEKLNLWSKALWTRGSLDEIRGNWASLTLYMLFLFSCVTVFLFMVLPLARRGRVPIPHFSIWLVYFTCLGVAFIFVEIAVMQRFALLLGHPSRSLALVLSSLLIFAGIGSQLKTVLNLALTPVLATLIVAILACAFGYPAIVQALLGQPYLVRCIAVIAMVAPLGVLMGIPFPSGIQKVSEHGQRAVPWMWGINGGSTVLGSILAIIVAIWLDFTTVLIVAAIGYAIALALNHRILKIR